MKAEATRTAAAAFQAAAAEGGGGGKVKQRERRLLEALAELKQSLISTPIPAPAPAAGGTRAPVVVPRSVLAAVVHACLLGSPVGGGADGNAAPTPPSTPVRVLAYQVRRCYIHINAPNISTTNTPDHHNIQTLLVTGLSLRAHALAGAAFREALVRAALADVNTATESEGSSSEQEQEEEEPDMDGDVAVLALRVLLLAATEGHLVALVRCVFDYVNAP